MFYALENFLCFMYSTIYFFISYALTVRNVVGYRGNSLLIHTFMALSGSLNHTKRVVRNIDVICFLAFLKVSHGLSRLDMLQLNYCHRIVTNESCED